MPPPRSRGALESGALTRARLRSTFTSRCQVLTFTSQCHVHPSLTGILTLVRHLNLMTEEYSNIREILGKFIGRTIIDITQHDKEEWDNDGLCYVQLMLDDGNYLRFPIGDEGFHYSEDDPSESTDS